MPPLIGDTMTIHQRMGAILANLPAIGKTQKNTQQNFMFRGHDDVLNALNPLFAKYGVFVVPDVLDRVTDRRETAKGSVMFEVNLHVRFTFYGPDGDSVAASTWGEGTDMGDKATNKAMTMAFKNVLNQAFAISTVETIDADSETPEETVKTPAGFKQPASVPANGKAQREALAVTLDLIVTNKWLTDEQIAAAVQKDFGCTMAELTEKQVGELVARLTKFVEDQSKAAA